MNEALYNAVFCYGENKVDPLLPAAWISTGSLVI